MAKKYFERCLSLLLALLIMGSMFTALSMQTLAASTKTYNPTVWVQGYADESRSNFRVSQTLVVKTSGFAPNAKIEYTYYSTNTKDNFYVIGGHYGRTYNVRLHIPLKALIAEKAKTSNKLKNIGMRRFPLHRVFYLQ